MTKPALRLADIEPHFLRAVTPGKMMTQRVDTFGEAQGIWFLCPKCFVDNGGAVGTHKVRIWFRDRDVPPGETPSPRWRATGTGVGDLTLAPSVHLSGPGCGWHGFIRNGGVTGA